MAARRHAGEEQTAGLNFVFQIELPDAAEDVLDYFRSARSGGGYIVAILVGFGGHRADLFRELVGRISKRLVLRGACSEESKYRA
jgi:hypothetical protein